MRKTRWLWLIGLVLVLGSCSDDSTSSGDAGDASGETSDVADTSDMTDTEETTPDVELEPDVPTGFGTISGSIFNNTGTTNGTLTVGLVSEVPVVGSPSRTTVFGSPMAPTQTYDLRQVPLGTYYIVALWDVGATDTFESPGEGDLFGATPEPFGLVTNGQVLNNINVEVE